jgi:hypothetical protein
MPDRRSAEPRDAESEQPQLYLVGGTDELYLEEEGRVFHPGDAMPRTLTNAKRMSLQTAGIQFGTEHPEPVAEPKVVAPGEAVVEASPDVGPGSEPRRSGSKE